MATGKRSFAKLSRDPREGTVTGPGGTVRLEPKVMAVLAALAEKPGRVIARTDLFDAVWPNTVVTEHTLSRCIYQLRDQLRKVSGEPDFDPIETLPKRGYRLRAAITSASGEDLAATRGLLGEMRRRGVLHLAAIYAVVAWGLTEALSFLVSSIPIFPVWSEMLIAILFVAGFPVAMFLAWMFDIGPRGEHRTRPAGRRRLLTVSAAICFLATSTAGLFYILYPRVAQRIPDAGRPIASVAVLPFENWSPDPDNAYFTDGLHDDLIMVLSKFSKLKVTSRTSVEAFRNTDETTPQIGRVLGVTHIVEGAVRRVDSRIRVNVQLIDAVADDHVWAQQYDEEVSAQDIFAIQSDIAGSIAKELSATLSLDEQQRLSTLPTQNLAALEAYFRGKQLRSKRTSASLAEAVREFRRAIDLDPDFALAHVGLADTYQLQIGYGGLPEDKILAPAESAVSKAIALDGRLGEAYAGLGHLKTFKADYTGAEAEYRKSIELNPNYAAAHHWYGNLLHTLGRFDEALVRHRKALDLDPLSASNNNGVAMALSSLGRFDEALAQYRRSAELDPAFASGYSRLAGLYWFAFGDLDAAVGWYRRSNSLDPGNPITPAYLAMLYLDLGDDGQAEHWANRSLELAPESAWANIANALLYTYRGDRTRASQSANNVLKTTPYYADARLLQWQALALLRNGDLELGRHAAALARYRRAYPTLLTEDGSEIDFTNFRVAIDLAHVLQGLGELERADSLLSRSQRLIKTLPRLGADGHWISDAQIHALKGRPKEALIALRRAVDAGWHASWRYYLEHDPNLVSLRSEPGFRAIVDDLKIDAARQLELAREIKDE